MVVHAASAQDQTIGKKENASPVEFERDHNAGKKKVLIIPFDNKMYMSEIDQEIAEQNQLNFNQIRHKFRKSLNDQIFLSLNSEFKAFSMLNEDKDVQEDLTSIYYSIGYRYEVLPKVEEEKDAKQDGLPKILGKKKGDAKKSEGKNGIRKGELISAPNNEERYMGTVISNQSILGHLSKKYGAEILIFINQIDVKRYAGADTYDLAGDDYKREIKVHYTIMDNTGKQIDSGAAFAYFSSKENDIFEIINATYPELIKKLISSIKKPENAEEETIPGEKKKENTVSGH